MPATHHSTHRCLQGGPHALLNSCTMPANAFAGNMHAKGHVLACKAYRGFKAHVGSGFKAHAGSRVPTS